MNRRDFLKGAVVVIAAPVVINSVSNIADKDKAIIKTTQVGQSESVSFDEFQRKILKQIAAGCEMPTKLFEADYKSARSEYLI